MTDYEKKLVSIVPSQRQLNWQATEFYAFIHYGVNQFTGREWGDGKEDPAIFNPTMLNTDQWCESFVKAGMKGVIITAKHHDGFCLWDTKYTKHSTMYSPYGKDIVAQLAESCKKYDIKLGMYLSPWDRHDQRYGQGKAYDDYFCNQLTELLSNYGEIFSCWFDGACGEGPNGKVQVYDWQRYYALIRELQPGAAISVCGPDVRWCGNEAGHCRESEWSVVPASMVNNEAVKESSQQTDDEEFRKRVPTDGQDLGSRNALTGHDNLVWYPAEVNTSIRPGWFYHEHEDVKVRSLEELTNIYIKSVGGNATFLLNIPPHPQGYLTQYDVNRLEELGNWIRTSLSDNMLKSSVFTASSYEESCEPTAINGNDSHWKAADNDPAIYIAADAGCEISPSYLVLQEEIRLGQRVESFVLSYWDGREWQQVVKGTVVGHKRICPLPNGIKSAKWKLEIPECRSGAALKTFALY